MPESPKRASVKISSKNLEAVAALAEGLGMTAAGLVDICIEDCLDALEKKRPVTPRLVKLVKALQRQKKK